MVVLRFYIPKEKKSIRIREGRTMWRIKLVAEFICLV